jgi:threonine/homoserine/homoserine lactone efflux protein
MVSGLVLLFLGIRIFRRNQEDGKENGKNDKN